MTTLLVLRHGRARRGSPTGADRDRPLDERGRGQAARVGRWLAEEGLVPDRVLASGAERAAATARLAAGAGGFEDRVVLLDELYGADVASWLERLRSCDDRWRRVLAVGHNPGLEALVGYLSDRDVRLSTGSLVRIDFPLEGWEHLGRGAGRLTATWRPEEKL